MSGAIWPWAEANQGLLSILALVAALAVALVEFLRAEQAERRLRSGFMRSVVALLDEVEQQTLGPLNELRAGAKVVHLWRWVEMMASARGTLDLLRASAPPDVRLILLLRKVSGHMAEVDRMPWEATQLHAEQFADWYEHLSSLRNEVARPTRAKRRR